MSHRPPLLFLEHCGSYRARALLFQFDVPPLILPHGLDAFLEEGVVATSSEPAGQLDVVVEGPEVFDLKDKNTSCVGSTHRGECDDLPLVLLPLLCLVVLEEPQGPGVLKMETMFDPSNVKSV
jgi:hypothetical protein